MARREYKAGRPTTLTGGGLAIGGTSFTIANDTNWPTGSDYPFWVTIDGGEANEERILCSLRSGTSVTVAASGRGKESTTESNHASGASVWPSWSATDADEANAHIESTGYASHSRSVHGIASGEGVVVGTLKTQELTNKTLTSPKINENVVLTATATELNYVDGVTSAIQTQLNTTNTAVTTNTPVGSMTMFGGASAPTGWLMCDGTAVSRTTYASLFAVIGTAYGAGDTTTTFNVPDLLGRIPMGAGTGTGLTARTLGEELGSESTTLTSSHIPEHNHTYNISHDHAAFNTTGGEGAHTHDIKTRKVTTSSHDHDNSDANVGPSTAAGSGAFGGTTQNDAALSAGAHNHSVNVPNYSVANSTSGNYGTASPTAVTAVQPSTVVNFIIKT
jgi:microcystin-dependent protein